MVVFGIVEICLKVLLGGFYRLATYCTANACAWLWSLLVEALAGFVQ
jgi:hypothetical protein